MIKSFIFDLQRFTTLAIEAGKTQTIDGVTYSAVDDDATLNLDGDGKVSGIASGKVEAVLADAETSPTVTFDATDGAFNFTAVAEEDDSLNVGYNDVKIHYTGGELTYTANSIEIPAGEVSVVGSGVVPLNATINFPAAATATFADGVVSANVKDVSGEVSIAGTTFGTLSIDGEISFNQTTREVNFAKGATIDVNLTILNNFDISLTALDNVGGIFAFNTSPMGIKFTPNSGDGALGIVISEAGTTKFEGEINCRAGSFTFGLSGGLSLESGTVLDVTINGMTATLTAKGDSPAEIGLSDGKITLTPGTNSSLEISADFIDITGDITLTQGSITFDPSTKEITVAKDTELQIDFGNDYVVSMKTTKEAGGAISIGTDGITFTPNEGDGGLELTVTKGEESRTASLDVTGSVTYKLDGSISLAQGTVVKNVFDDGNILTITANTAASGSIVFSPDSGLTIEPSTTDALEVTLTTGNVDIVNITSIDGTINYSGGLITASDGTKAHIKYYFDWESELSTSGGTASIRFTDDRTVYTANEGANFVIKYSDGETIEIQNGSFSDIYENDEHEAMELITEGSILKTNDIDFVTTLEKAGNYTLNGMNVTTTEDMVEVQLSGNYDTIIVNGISYTPLDEDVTLTIDGDVATVEGGKVSLQMEGFDKVANFDTTDGSISYDSSAGKFTIANGTKTYLGNGEFPDQFVAQSDFDINVTKNSDGTFTLSSGDSAALAIERNGKIVMSTTLTLDGSLIVDPSNNQITMPQGTVLSMTPDEGKTVLEIKALDDAGGQLSFVDDGIRFAPNTGDGALEFNFASSNRKVQLDVTGAFIYKGLGALELEDGTEATFTWEDDGTTLKLTSSGSTGSIGLDPELGIKITSDDENLDMTLTTSSMSTDISGVKGTIYYKEGTVTFAENSKITATTTLGGQPILTTLETIDGTGHISFAENQNGVVYSADTGAMRITWTNADGLESTFTINSGSIQIGHNLFKIAEGTDLATDLKDFVPALNFTTSEAGEYTINGQKITTSAEGLALKATDDYMSFVTSDDNKVEYDDMTFAGSGNVSLKPDIVVLGKDVVATGFKEGKSFMLAEAGNVTADAKVFELTEQKNKLDEDIPLNVSVEGATDGFIFSRTITRESEDYFDDPDYDNVGKIFTEKFIVHGDDSYRTRTDPLGLQEVIGISDGATIEGGATLGDEVSPSRYDLVTDTNGSFTIGENTYKIADDTEVGVVLHAAFEDGLSYASAVKNLNGTISGNFSDGGFAVNGNDSLNVYGDTDISIIGSGKEYEILGLDDGASLKVSAAGTYDVNGTEIVARAGDVIVGTSDGEAEIYYANTINNTVNNTLITGTENSDFIFNSGTGVTIQALGDNDYIENNVDSSLDAASLANSIDAGDGNDVIYSYHTYNPTLLGGDGSDSIVVESGHKTFADGGAGNDKIIGVSQEGGWGMGDYATILGGDGDDYIDPIYSIEASINGGDGNDTIRVNGENATVDGGAGNNLIISTDTEGGVKGKFIVLNGNTTVENFNTGFNEDLDPEMGEGTDTVYITGESPAVDFKDEGLTLYYDDDETKSLTFADTNTTTKLNLYYEASLKPVSEVFIADDDWYKVTENDLSAAEDRELWFVGATAKMNHGIDFSGIESDLNVSLLGHNHPDEVDNLFINNIHSIKGGAGNTTISGSEKSDTIVTGSGDTTIDAAGGDDLISLTGGAALIQYASGYGNDTIVGFDETATLSIGDSTYSTQVSGNDLIITVGESKITLVDAANLSDPNIESTNEAVNLIEILLKRTALGYPIASGVLLNPEEFIGEEPTNYSAKEEWTITSADKLKLHAVHYTPENSNDKWVVLVHGYGLKHESMYPFTYFYLANGYNVLMIDQRAAGNSEGTWLTMGAAESQDVALWTQEIARRNSNAKITLHGVSMGAATAMLAASREDAVNVTSLIEDCGYTDTIKLFYVLKDVLNEGLKEFGIEEISSEVVAAMDSVGYGMMGYYLHDASPINSISSAKMPTLFIHGDDDGVVPVSMVSELYDESGAEVKEKFIVEGAGHAQSGLNDLDGYSNTVFRFIAEANGEGWVTTNTTDNISLRGTKYDDTITNSGDDVTINGGKGDDLISLSSDAKDNVIEYTQGDGNDTIYGFNDNSSLKISGDITSVTSGDDLVITVGDSKITLIDAANLSDPNIEAKNPLVELVENILKRTEAGYPAMAAAVFDPTGNYGDEPTNYVDKEDWTITSADKLKLHAVHYTPENSNDKWVVLIHGYGNNHTAMYTYAQSYLANGYNVLMIDQRAAGESEGEWLTMGAAESQDVALWTKEIARRNSNAKITLHGVSMGAATAMLAAARSDAKNVTSIVEDCGYSKVLETFSLIIANTPELGISPAVVPYLDPVAASLTGYHLTDAAPIDSISSVKVPSLFISGDADTVAPVSMLEELYKESGAEVKEQFIVEGAKHALAVFDDSIGYNNAVFRFVAEADGEGWVTTNMTDNISLRGTKYDDTITNSGSDVTIDGGKGDDLISLTSDAGDNVIEYTQGDGNDTIYGFNDTDRLSISGAPFTAHKSGDDIIVTVDEENITLVDAASLSSTLDIVNQKGVTSDLIINSTNNTLVTGTDEDDHIINSGTTVTIQGYGGDDYIENNVDSSVTAAEFGNSIDAGTGNDTIYNYHTYNPTLLGGEGNDSIVVTRGHLTYVDGGAGNDTILGKKDSGGWDMGGYATVLGDEGNDYIDTGYINSASIDGGEGNDTIFASGNNITINGGEGKNLIKVSPSSLDANNACAYIIFNGDTTVQGFKTGFGNGSDTVYIPGDPAAVDFKSGVLTFYDDNNSLTLSDVHTTAKVNLFHEKRDVLNKGVFIAEGDWYKVADSDLTVDAGEEVYFVGPSASPNRGVDFSGISSDLNLTLDTAYVDSEDYVPTTMWINGVYSIKGGAGLTTITGSKNSDTIIGGKGETTINGKAGDDLISLSSGAALIEYTLGDGNDSIVGFKANSTLSISGGKYSLETQDDKSILHIGDEAITIFGASDGNIIGERFISVEELQEIYGDKLTVVSGSVELGDEGAAVAVYEENSAVDIVGGAGNDTLIALGSAPITFDMSAGGADKIALVSANQNVTLENYNPSNGGGIATGNPNIASMVEEIMEGKDTRFGNGNVSVKTSEETQSVFTFDSPIINFFDAHNRILPVGFTNSNGGTVDVSNSDADYLLIGNYFGEKTGGSTLFGGSGDDTLLGGAGDLLDADGGNNEIYLAGGGARIGLAGGGRTAVHNFQTGFDGDALYSEGDIAARIRFDGENITASVDGGAQVKLESVADNADFAELLMYEGEEETKIAVAKPGSTIKSYSADIYLGRENAAVDFSGMTDDLLVNLSNEPVVTGSDQKQFFGINQVTAGDGNSTLIGTDGDETLIAGKGNTSIYGGAGYDSLVGNTDKTGSTTFFFEPGDGRDVIDNFDFSADKIDIGNNVIKDASLSRGKVFVDFEDGSRLIIRDAVGKDFQIGDMIAKVDTNISYDGLADCYVATGGSSLTVDSTVESAEIWLDNSHDTQFIGNIRTLDASAVKGNTLLVGNDFNNTIIAGQGDSSLWGGWSASDDVLIGGAAHNEFYYEVGNGRDTIQSANDGDVINLGASLEQINFDNTQITSSGVVVQFNDGGSLTVDGTAEVTFALDDGTRTKVNHQTQQFE